MPTDGDWSEYARQVLAELQRHDKWLAKLDKKMDNHITHIEHRLTEIETCYKNSKWMIGILMAAVLGIFGMVFVQMIT